MLLRTLGPLSAALRAPVAAVALFSLAVNLLLLSTSIYLMQVYDRALVSGSRETLGFLTLLAGGAVVVLGALDVLRRQILSRLSTWIDQRLAQPAMSRMIDAAVGGGRINPVKDLTEMRGFVSGNAILAVFDMPWIPLWLAVIWLFHPLLGQVTVAGAVLLFALAVANDRFTRAPLKAATAAGGDVAQATESALRNAMVIDGMGMAESVLHRWSGDVERCRIEQARVADRAAVTAGLSRTCRLLIQIAMIGVGAWLVLHDELTAGAMIAASIIMSRALAPVEQAISTWRQTVQAAHAYRRLGDLLRSSPRRRAALPLPAPTGRLAFENVSFGYDADRPPLLKAVSFVTAPGEMMGIVGPSGAGKSTLARLAVGIDRPGLGSVRLDGAEIFAWNRGDLGRHVGFVPQEVELFPGTVAENIARLAEPNAEAVVAAARLADCHDMILRLPQGYETPLGLGGGRLSGGQRQRIALARALYRNPKLLVLDEPNSNLDAEGERALATALGRAKAAGAAVIVIGHRPGVMNAVDRLVVLVDGRVEDQGPREEVMKRMLGRSIHAVPAAVRVAAVRPQSPTATDGSP